MERRFLDLIRGPGSAPGADERLAPATGASQSAPGISLGAGAQRPMNLLRLLRRSAILLLATFCLAPLPAPAQAEPELPLPDVREFFDEVRQNLHTDEYLLDQYTFTERRIERRFDAKGNVTKETHEVCEVYPSARPRRTYRKIIERNGQRLSEKELAEQDRDYEKKIPKTAEDDKAAEAKRRERQARRDVREREIIDELFRIYDITIAGRDTIEGRRAIVVTFRPRPDVKPSNRTGKIFQKFSGRAWIDEEDRQVVRADAELLDTFSYGLGVLARLYKGATTSLHRRKINGEVWLPAEARFTGRARLLLLKGLRIDSLSEYSDYKKFNVETETAIEPEESAQ